MSKSYHKCLQIVKEVAAAMDEGYEVIWANEPKRLCWTWCAFKQEDDQEITQSWTIRLSEVKRLLPPSTDLRNGCLKLFVLGKINAKEALSQIERLEKLTAFW
jgi:hypothetical protein